VSTTAFWVAFNRVNGIGPARLRALLEVCGTVDAAWRATLSQMQAARLDRKSIEALLLAQRSLKPDAELERVLASRVQVLTWDDAEYPVNLRTIDGSPPVLYLRGALTDADDWSVAVVGTRHASSYGREVAHTLGRELARAGITVVSGLALGIDTVAHKAALEAGGRTVAVLAGGVDQVYPPQNLQLAQEIRSGGALLSEYAPGCRPESNNFPARNRIISGLSRGVVIVEAGERSGALITASFAAEQGRELFAVPGSILHPGSVGCNRLLQQGATPLLSVDDVLEQLDMTRAVEQQSVRRSVPADPQESHLLSQLGSQPVHVDDLVRQMGLPAPALSGLLVMMELKGLVRQSGAMMYVRA
jgi:DNA processing protein